MREFIIGLLLMSFAFSLANPSAVYCEGLGYEYRIVETGEGQEGVCVLPDETEVNPWDFLAGTVGEEYSYCAQNGYGLVAGEGVAECILPNGSSASISELMDLGGGGGVIEPGEEKVDGAVPEPAVISVGEDTGEEGSETGEGGENETGGEDASGSGEPAEEDGFAGVAIAAVAAIIIGAGAYWLILKK